MIGLIRSLTIEGLSDSPTASAVAANLPDSVPVDLRDDVAQAIARTLQAGVLYEAIVAAGLS